MILAMCLLFLAIDTHPDYRLVAAANRDEFYDRPTSAAHRWAEHQGVIAGKDLEKGGTWFGVTRYGHWAAVTNYRESNDAKFETSRGALVSEYLTTYSTPDDYIASLAASADHYNGFNLVAGSLSHAVYFSNRERGVKPLQKGIYGLSNHLLDTPWPKVRTGKQNLENLLERDHLDADSLFSILCDQTRASNEDLPESGVSAEWEELLSSAFISGDTYGTRSSTILLVSRDNRLILEERTYAPAAPRNTDNYSSVAYEFDLEDQPV